MPSAVCELLHPHLHRGVGRQIPACHHRPRWHQRCGQWHQIISTLKPINLFFMSSFRWASSLVGALVMQFALEALSWQERSLQGFYIQLYFYHNFLNTSLKTYQYRQAHSLQFDVNFVFKLFENKSLT